MPGHSILSMPRRQLLLAFAAGAALGPLSAHAGAFEDYFKAVKNDDVDTVRSLLERGFDPNTIDASLRDTGLILAVREGSMKVFKLLLDTPGVDIEAKSHNGDDALMIASYKGNLPAVQALLAKGAHVNRPGWTALHYAAAAGADDIVKLLIAHHANLDARSPNKTTPMMMAARGGHIMIVKTLLDAGADATLKNALGLNAIDFAQRHGFNDIVEGLTYRLKKAGKM